MRRDDPGPYSLERLSGLATPQLFSTDGAAIKRQLVTWFEAETGRTLYPMQIEMLLIETLAYAMATLGEEAQMVVEQHLVAKASAAGLEALGPNRSMPRLASAAARVTIRFTRTAPSTGWTLIPAGTRVGSGDVVFSTLEPKSLAPAAVAIEITAEATVAGAAGNGFQPGQIATMLDPVAGVSAANVTISSGGADMEDVEAYRLRLANAFEHISTGGSRAWYRETAIGVSSALIDVAVVRPQPCYVDIYPLTIAGAPGVDLLASVAAAFNTSEALDIRFGDEVTVKPPVAVTCQPSLTVRVDGASSTIQADATAAAQAVLTGWRQRLGARVAPSDVETAVKTLAGVVDVAVAGLNFHQLAAAEYLVATSLEVNVVTL